MATTSKQTPPPDPPRVTLREDDDGRLIAEYPWKLYRFLLNDGSTVDVLCIRDDSDVRGEVLRVTGSPKIEGVAVVGIVEHPALAQPVIQEAKPVKRTRKVARSA